jgi:hypothetical protein
MTPLKEEEHEHRIGAESNARKGQNQRELTISACCDYQGGNVFTPMFTPEPEMKKPNLFQIGLSH